MSKAFLIFASALVALMAGALFYAARIPIEVTEPAGSEQELVDVAAPIAEATVAPAHQDTVVRPEFVLPDISGTDRDFSEWAGKNRIVNFWATWCGPCRREIPLLKAFQDEQGSNGFQVIGIAVDFADAVADYAESVEFNYPVLVGEQEAMAVAESSGIQFVGLPFTMFVASDGDLIGAYIGELHAPHFETVVTVMTQLDRAEISKDEARTALRAL